MQNLKPDVMQIHKRLQHKVQRYLSLQISPIMTKHFFIKLAGFFVLMDLIGPVKLSGITEMHYNS